MDYYNPKYIWAVVFDGPNVFIMTYDEQACKQERIMDALHLKWN